MEKIGIFYGSTTGITSYYYWVLRHGEAEIFKTTGMTSSTESKPSISKIKPLLYSVAETNL